MKYDRIVELKQQQEKENLEIVQRAIKAVLDRKERISVTALAKYTGLDRTYFYKNKQARQLVEEAQLSQGECYNPKKVIIDHVTENVNQMLKKQIKFYKKRIAELEEQVRILTEENEILKERK